LTTYSHHNIVKYQLNKKSKKKQKKEKKAKKKQKQEN